MSINLSPSEAFHVLMALHKDAHLDPNIKLSLTDRLKSVILSLLEAEEEKKKDEAFLIWHEQESKKINDLKRQNYSLDKPALKTARRK